MPRAVDYNRTLLRDLRNPGEAAAYLNAVLEEGDTRLFLKALGKVAEAQGGMSKLAGKTKYSRMGLYKIFSEIGNPEFKTVEDILHAFHLKLAVRQEKIGA